jgi:steroid Delta-isomerase
VTDLLRALADHVAAFNQAVDAGSFDAFVERFAADAEMVFVNVPIGPFRGREAIRAAYLQSPPDDTMTVVAAAARDGGIEAAFRWSSGGTGSMFLRWADGLVTQLEIRFDMNQP